MRRLDRALTVLFLAACAVWAQPRGPHFPAPGAPKVELKGKIEKIRIAHGQGMPSLTIRAGDKAATVWLGSMRYLVEQDFRPKAGDDAEVSGYQAGDGVVAVTVTTGGKTLRLRDDAGFPLWSGGRRGPPPARGR
jgi:hypothetical protein